MNSSRHGDETRTDRMPVLPARVRRGKVVYLAKDLPPYFGNRHLIVAWPVGSTQRRGEVTSNGFEGGVLRVFFPIPGGDERLTFDVYHAEMYLVCDPYG